MEYFLIDTCNTFDLCYTCFPAMRRGQVSRNQFERDQPTTKAAQRIQPILTTKWKKRIPCEYSHENQEKEESNDFYKMMINPIEAMHLLELSRKVLG